MPTHATSLRTQDDSIDPMTGEYAVIDVETANPARRSICQIGLVLMHGTEEISATSWLVDPGGPVTLTWLHGITKEMLQDAPAFPTIYPEIIKAIGSRSIVSHTTFDPQAIRACCNHYSLPELPGPWFDSTGMIRHIRGMPCPESCSLPDVCAAYGISLHHHDALSDARAAARLTAMAIKDTGLSVSRLALSQS